MAELDDLRCFVEVVESGGFGRAARRLGVSKSIVSRSIARLEAHLGARLLSRTTRGISPTEAGLEFKARSERILADLEEAREAIAQQGGGVVGRLRVSVPLSYWLDVQQHWEASQLKKGGWGYTAGDENPTLSMTSAGVNMLFVANEMISATRPETQIARPPFSPALQGGLDWLGTGDNAVTIGGWRYYTLYGLERAGLACGFKMFGAHDWFRVLAAETIKGQRENGSWRARRS